MHKTGKANNSQIIPQEAGRLTTLLNRLVTTQIIQKVKQRNESQYQRKTSEGDRKLVK